MALKGNEMKPISPVTGESMELPNDRLGRLERMVCLIAEALVYENDMPLDNCTEMMNLIKEVRNEYADRGQMDKWRYIP
jgi:hypothetical protein